MKRILYVHIILIACVAVSLSGCQVISKKKLPISSVSKKKPTVQTPSMASLNPIPKLTKPKLATGRPENIVAIWKDATYTVANEQPTRGFGGRLYFYDREKNPIVVDGDLVIYGFDDDHSTEKPEKRFVFDREKLQTRMAVSAVGPSYNVWLPWDHINGEQKNVTIVAMFRDRVNSNFVCRSEPISALLPGRIVEKAPDEGLIESLKQETAIRTNVKKVGFEENMPKGTKKVKSHEIRIPSGSHERLFHQVPKSTYMLPKPTINIAHHEDVIEPSAKSPEGSLPLQPQAQSGRFVRQGLLPPGSKPPQLGARSSSVRRQ